MRANAEEGFRSLGENVPSFASSDNICHTSRRRAFSARDGLLQRLGVRATPGERMRFWVSFSPVYPAAGRTDEYPPQLSWRVRVITINIKGQALEPSVLISPVASGSFCLRKKRPPCLNTSSSPWIGNVWRTGSGSCCLFRASFWHRDRRPGHAWGTFSWIPCTFGP